MTDVLSPCPGRVFPITEVSDPVFAQELVGPGVAIEPGPGRTTVVAPVSGTIVKLHPHAFALATPGGLGILVHLGIETMKLAGAGFTVEAEEGAVVEAGAGIVTWDPSTITGEGISTTVLVVALDSPPGSVDSPVLGREVASGELLFRVG